MTDATLDLVAWNVYIGNSVPEVRDALKILIKETNPDVIVLMEASRMFGHLGGLGYKIHHSRPRPRKPGNQPAQGNIAILVRDGIPIKKRGVMKMTTFWLGPKHGWPQDPRIYRWVKIKFNGQIWKIGGAHTPFGEKARVESRGRLVRWFKNATKFVPKRPTVLALDANMNLRDFREAIAQPGGALAAGDGIDLIGYKNAVLLLAKNLGRRVSDHPAMYYKLRARV